MAGRRGLRRNVGEVNKCGEGGVLRASVVRECLPASLSIIGVAIPFCFAGGTGLTSRNRRIASRQSAASASGWRASATSLNRGRRADTDDAFDRDALTLLLACGGRHSAPAILRNGGINSLFSTFVYVSPYICRLKLSLGRCSKISMLGYFGIDLLAWRNNKAKSYFLSQRSMWPRRRQWLAAKW